MPGRKGPVRPECGWGPMLGIGTPTGTTAGGAVGGRFALRGGKWAISGKRSFLVVSGWEWDRNGCAHRDAVLVNELLFVDVVGVVCCCCFAVDVDVTVDVIVVVIVVI